MGEGVQGLRDQRVYAMPAWVSPAAFAEFSPPASLKDTRSEQEARKADRSPLPGRA